MLLANLRHGGAVDEYLQDQVMALPGKTSEPIRFEYLVVGLNVHFNDWLSYTDWRVVLQLVIAVLFWDFCSSESRLHLPWRTTAFGTVGHPSSLDAFFPWCPIHLPFCLTGHLFSFVTGVAFIFPTSERWSAPRAGAPLFPVSLCSPSVVWPGLWVLSFWVLTAPRSTSPPQTFLLLLSSASQPLHSQP